MKKVLLPLCAAFAICAAQADAATMTFTGLTGDNTNTLFFEDGIRAEGLSGGLATFGTPDTAHLDDFGTPYTETIAFTLDSGHRFTAVSFDLLPIPIGVPGIVFDNVQVRGFRSGNLVASDDFFMGSSPSTYSFGGVFSLLDQLTIGLTNVGSPGDYCEDRTPCAHMNIDNVVLAPSAVPAPAALPLLATGLGFLLAFGRRRRGVA